jgi:hypothetical protein
MISEIILAVLFLAIVIVIAIRELLDNVRPGK